MNHPMPTLANLRKAHEVFNGIEPRGFIYWSSTKLVSAVIGTNLKSVRKDELVQALMTLLMIWNRNYYRFRLHGKLERHFGELEVVISKHFDRLMDFRKQRIQEVSEIPHLAVQAIFEDFKGVLGRVGAAKCLHLMAPGFFPLWDVAILRGYGMDRGEYRNRTDAERYVAFINIARVQIDNIGDFGSFADNPLKILDEYNYCHFTKHEI